ncbi:MAG: hypothetical protein ABFD97_06525 [Syntrophobacter sp.]
MFSKWLTGREILDKANIREFNLLHLAHLAHAPQTCTKLKDGERYLPFALPLAYTYASNDISSPIHFKPSAYTSDSEREKAISILMDCIFKMDSLPDELKKSLDLPEKVESALPPMITSEPDKPDAFVFRKNGDEWEIVFNGKPLERITKYPNLKYIHYLIQKYSEENKDTISAVELEIAIEGSAVGGIVDKGIMGYEECPIIQGSRAEKWLQDNACEGMKSSKENLKEHRRVLMAEIEDAKGEGDDKLREELEAELDKIGEWSINLYGPKGNNKDKKSSDAQNMLENARKRVSGKIKKAITKLSQYNKPLSDHLTSYVHLGAYLSYKPTEAIKWTL